MAYARLDVLRQHEHGDVGVVVADSLGGDEPFVGVGRWHPDVDHGDVGCVRLRPRSSSCVGVLGLADDVDAGVAEQADDALARQQRVVGDYDAHGISARSRRRRRLDRSSERADAVGEIDDARAATGSLDQRRRRTTS